MIVFGVVDPYLHGIDLNHVVYIVIQCVIQKIDGDAVRCNQILEECVTTDVLMHAHNLELLLWILHVCTDAIECVK